MTTFIILAGVSLVVFFLLQVLHLKVQTKLLSEVLSKEGFSLVGKLKGVKLYAKRCPGRVSYVRVKDAKVLTEKPLTPEERKLITTRMVVEAMYKRLPK